MITLSPAFKPRPLHLRIWRTFTPLGRAVILALLATAAYSWL